jgi:hypothetical protein
MQSSRVIGQVAAASRRGFASKAAAGEHFPGISKIKYEGPGSLNPLAFKHYKADEKILGKVRAGGRECPGGKHTVACIFGARTTFHA